MANRRKKRKRRGNDIAVPTASMADIAFLLIIFFILVGVFSKEPVADLDSPLSKDVEKVEEIPLHYIHVDRNSRLLFDGKEADSVDALVSRVQAAYNDVAEPEKRRVVIRAHGGIEDIDMMQDILAEVTKIGVTPVLAADKEEQ